MIVIADNITTRDAWVRGRFRQLKDGGWSTHLPAAGQLKELARRCREAGADLLEINTQQQFDHPEAMSFAVKTVQEAVDCKLCLSTDNPDALRAGLEACRNPAVVNYVSMDEARLKGMLPLAAKHKAQVVLLVSDPSNPGDAREMLKRAAILIGAANEAGVTNENIILDPGLFHVTRAAGQQHLVEVAEFMKALPDTFEPPVQSTCWIKNGSTGAAPRLRPVIEGALLTFLSGLGVDSVFLDVLRPETMRALRLARVFRNELIYSDGELGLRRF
ncbi:MAG: dihydropteroate synthase [Chloroflexi bacterium]|nr:dihydropteroate synthase [Chloroflexota bacterium]